MESSSCFNCTKSYSISTTTLLEDNNIEVSYALGLLFEGYLKLHQTTIPAMDPTNPQYKIGLCIDCGLVLSDLVSLYIKFMSLTTAHSELAKLIQDTSLWTFDHCHQLQEEEGQEILKQCCTFSGQDDDDHTIITDTLALDHYEDDKHMLDEANDIKVELSEESHDLILPDSSIGYADDQSITTEGNGSLLLKKLIVKLERLNPNEIKSFASKKSIGKADKSDSVTSTLQRIRQLTTSKSSSSSTKTLTRREIRRREKEKLEKEKQMIRKQQREVLKQAKLKQLQEAREEKARLAGKSLSCPHCTPTITFSYYSDLADHLKTAHSTEFPCKYCPEGFPRQYFLTEHMNKVHPEIKKWRECSFCQKTFVTGGNLKSHILVHHTPGFNGLTCAYCSKIYTTVGVLNNHMLKFHAEALLVDVEQNQQENIDADAEMKQQQQQTNKVQTTPGNPNYCRSCGLKFPSKMKYLAHKALKHPKVKRRWSCTLCDDSFNGRPTLIKHYKSIHNLKNPMSQQEIEDLNLGGGKVKVNHDNDDDRSCDVCGKLFVYPSEVKYHKQDKHSNNDGEDFKSARTKYQIKSNRRPCIACIRGFKDLDSLKEHVDTCHSNQSRITIEEPGPNADAPSESYYYQQCTQCSENQITKWFTNILYLQRHKKLTHDKHPTSSTPQKIHVCTECGKTFRWTNNLETHMRNEHSSSNSNPKTFQCDECGKCFVNQAGLKLHLTNSSTRHEAVRDKKFQCLDCNTRYLSEASYAAHLQLHKTNDIDKLTRNSCKLCGKVFHLPGHLKRHMKETHAPPDHRPYICQLCGKGFKGPHLLKAHLNTKGHGGTGEPPRKPRRRNN